MNYWKLLVCAFAALTLAACMAKEAPVSDAAEVDVSHLERIESVLQEEVDDGVRAGFVALVATKNGVAYQTAVGMADPYNDIPMAANTRFLIASMTKPIVTAAMMQLVDRGEVALNDPASLYIPSFANVAVAVSHSANEEGEFETRPPSRAITIHDLLTHMSGLGYVFDSETDLGKAYLAADLYGKGESLAERIEKLTTLPLYEDPGTKWRYSFSTDVVGRIIEIASGMNLEQYLKTNMFTPLGMNDTEFFLDETDFERLAAVNAFDENGRMVRAEGVGDEGFGVMSGGGGLISTAPDYARFMIMLLNDGTLDGARILSPASVKLMMSEHTPFEALPDNWKRDGITFGLGGAIIQTPGYFGRAVAEGEWGWSGLWDTSFFITPKLGVAEVLLAQTVPGPHTPPSRARDRVRAITYGALE